MATGVVTFFNEAKGVGQIVPDAGGGDLRVVRARLQGVSTLTAGQRVEFHVVQGDRGREASAVRPV